MLFDEVARCLSAKAYRAAYILTWVCAAESLRSKFVTMSDRDAEVGRILGQIEHAEQQDHPADKLLLEKAGYVGIVSEEEQTKLAHIREMRNIYAHPSGAGPGMDEALTALIVVGDIVLSRPPLLRQGYVANLVRSLFDDRHFLDDIPERVREYAAGVARRVHPDVLPFLFGKLAERLEPTTRDPELGLFFRRGVEFATVLLEHVGPNLSDDRWNLVQVIQRYPKACSLILSAATVWTHLPDQPKDMILGHLVEPVEGGIVQPPTSAAFGRAWELKQTGRLSARQEQRVTESIERSPYSVLRDAGVSLSGYVQKVVSDLASHNWHVQNPAAKAVRDAGIDESGQLEAGLQEELGRNILQAADGTAVGAESLMRLLRGGDSDWPRRLIEGLLLETLVNEQAQFRLKERHFANALRIALEHAEVAGIFEHAVEAVRSSLPKFDWTAPEEYDQAVAKIEEVEADVGSVSRTYLRRLKRAVLRAKSRAETVARET